MYMEAIYEITYKESRHKICTIKTFKGTWSMFESMHPGVLVISKTQVYDEEN